MQQCHCLLQCNSCWKKTRGSAVRSISQPSQKPVTRCCMLCVHRKHKLVYGVGTDPLG